MRNPFKKKPVRKLSQVAINFRAKVMKSEKQSLHYQKVQTNNEKIPYQDALDKFGLEVVAFSKPRMNDLYIGDFDLLMFTSKLPNAEELDYLFGGYRYIVDFVDRGKN